MNSTKSKEFREKIRVLKRLLDVINHSADVGCCSISSSQCNALVEIGRKESITLKELASIIMLDTSTTSRTVDSLVKKGLVNRTISVSDRRSIDITLTDSGHALFQNIESYMDSKFDTVLNNIEDNQQDTVLNSLDLILDALKR